MRNKILMLIICFTMTMVSFGQEKPFDDNINWFEEKGGNGHEHGHSNGNGHRPGHSNGNGHNHDAPVGTSTLLLLGLATGSIIYKISKNK
jgi:hypothetical protein